MNNNFSLRGGEYKGAALDNVQLLASLPSPKENMNRIKAYISKRRDRQHPMVENTETSPASTASLDPVVEETNIANIKVNSSSEGVPTSAAAFYERRSSAAAQIIAEDDISVPEHVSF